MGFHTTHWSVVLAAGADPGAARQEALQTLCTAYWLPLYAFARRSGQDAHAAEDLTQGFFAELLEKDWVGTADSQRGRFRTFLLVAFKRHIGHQRERAQAARRGGGKIPLSLDFADGERRYSLTPIDDLTPERVFERRWAVTLLDRVLGDLREEMLAAGKVREMEELLPFLTRTTDLPSHEEVAERLGSTPGAVKTAVHRLRSRYRERLRAEVAQTVAEPEEVDAELRHLLEALR